MSMSAVGFAMYDFHYDPIDCSYSVGVAYKRAARKYEVPSEYYWAMPYELRNEAIRNLQDATLLEIMEELR